MDSAHPAFYTSSDTLQEQVSHFIASSTPPSSSVFFYLLPPCIILLVIDVAVRISYRPEPLPPITTTTTVGPSAPPHPFHDLAARASQVLADFKELDRRLEKKMHSKLPSPRNLPLVVWTKGNLSARHYNTPRIRPAIMSMPAQHPPGQNGTPNAVSSAFSNFCERLLLMNRVWKQQREIKGLRDTLRSTKASKCSNAFQAFCDRLLLSNQIWKMQRQIDELIAEGEKMKRSRVAAVTRAAKQMVLDVRKERLLEEFVKDLIQELEESKRVVGEMKEVHEHEILALTGEWSREYRKLAREVERLQLAREASLVEQDLSNDLEGRLCEEIASSKRKVDDNWAVDGEVDSDVEVMSNMSSSTCVEFNESPRSSAKARISRESPKRTHRRGSSLVLKVPPHAVSSKPLSPLSPIRKLDTGPYVGFSFNPLFFGHAESTLSEANEKMAMHDITSGVESRRRTLSLKLPQHESGESASVSRAGHKSELEGIRSLKRVKASPWKV
jgi:hypothetical protein